MRNYLSDPCREKKINRGRVLVIWDNNAFSGKFEDYLTLSDELSKSNAVLVCSAYAVTSGESSRDRRVRCIGLDSSLLPDEKKSMYKMLEDNLGLEYKQSISDSLKKSNSTSGDAYHITGCESKILTLIQRLFRFETDEEYVDIMNQASMRVHTEATANNENMAEFLEERMSQVEANINAVEEDYYTDLSGLRALAERLVPSEEAEEEWSIELKKCAPWLNDIIAVAGQFHLRLPLRLVENVLTDPDICPRMYRYMDVVEELLANDSMLEYPFPIDEYGERMVGYRSPEEAKIYLEMHYEDRDLLNMTCSDDDYTVYRADREIYILERIIRNSDLGEYQGGDFKTAQIIKELIDQFGGNARTEEKQVDKYIHRYKELADWLMQYGGEENPEIALSAAYFLKLYVRDFAMDSMDTARELITKNKNITGQQKEFLNKATTYLEIAMEMEKQERNETTPRMMRLYVEWCSNRNYVINRQNPKADDINLFYRIHERFSKALHIYLSGNVKRGKPLEMLDVYLNAFELYVNNMESLYGVQSHPEKVAKEHMERYQNEIFFALERVIGNLCDTSHLDKLTGNLTEKIILVYKLAKKSLSTLKKQARARGSRSFLFLEARNLWIDDVATNDFMRSTEQLAAFLEGDHYMVSDYAECEGGISHNTVKAAQRVYEYLTSNENYTVIKADNNLQNQGIACLEMLIRATWIIKTGNVPYTQNLCPKLSRADWDELHRYCELYINAGFERAKYSFAYYLEGIYYWLFKTDKSAYGQYTSRELFECCKKGKKPRELQYYTDTFLVLCALETKQPIVFDVNLSRVSHNRVVASIIDAENSNVLSAMPNVRTRKNIYCASSLITGVVTTKREKIAIRFNLSGALAGPYRDEREGDYE